MKDTIESRLELAKWLCEKLGEEALRYFERLDTLAVESKGPQDRVTEADRNVETLARKTILEHFPDDGIIGEEHEPTEGSSGYDWVIDPIDGTNNFVSGIPVWTNVLACVEGSRIVAGVIHDPNMNEMFYCRAGGGAFLNGEPIEASRATSLGEGILGMGFSRHSDPEAIARIIEVVMNREGSITKNGSGALSLAYAACGRFIGFLEFHMNAWDCLAGLLMIQESGGNAANLDVKSMLASGGQVVVGGPGLIEEIDEIVRSALAS